MPSICVEDGRQLNIHRMVASELARGASFYSGIWAWSRNGKRVASISYSVQREGEDRARMTLRYSHNDIAVEYSFWLIAEPCRFGGLRWFAICPRTARKAAKLYMPPGARYFYARQAWRIAYRSQNVSAGFGQLCNRRDRILSKKLKSDDPEFPLKPKWMRWKTFDTHLAHLDRLHTNMDIAILRRFGAHMSVNFI